MQIIGDNAKTLTVQTRDYEGIIFLYVLFLYTKISGLELSATTFFACSKSTT